LRYSTAYCRRCSSTDAKTGWDENRAGSRQRATQVGLSKISGIGELHVFATRFGLVKLGQLLVKIANGRVGRLLCHPAALRGAFQMERTVVLYGHRPSPLRQLPLALPEYHGMARLVSPD